MNQDIKDIIELFNKEYPPERTFETEHFVYWVQEFYKGVDGEVTREEFKTLRDYVAENNKLPGVDYVHNTGVEGCQRMLRYSKTYDCLEFYKTTSELRANNFQNNGKVVIMDRKHPIFRVNKKGHVRIGRHQYLSLKNWNHLTMSISQNVTRVLMSKMLGGKDWVHELEIKGYPEFPNKISRKVNSLDHLVEVASGSKPVKLFKKVFTDIEDLIKINKVIAPNQVHMLTTFMKQNRDILNELNNPLRFGSDAYDMIYYHFVSKDNRCDKVIIADYCKMLAGQDMKINLNLSSHVSIKNKHDELSRYIIANTKGGPALNVSKKFKELQSTEDIEVEMIKTSNRLDAESMALHHCVHSYKDAINNGDCAIYSIKYEDKSYTLQLQSYKEEDRLKYRIAQLKGSRNCNPPLEMRTPLETMIQKNEIEIISKSGVSFGNYKETREVESVPQVGAAVLEKILNGEHKTQTVHYNNDLPF